MSTQSLAVEIGEIARIARGFGQRHNVPAAELLPFQRRKAETLTVIACERGDAGAIKVASAAWRRVRELHEQVLAVDGVHDSCPGPHVDATVEDAR
jgi:hypothetical protein